MKPQNDVAPGRWLAYTPAVLFIVLLLLSVQLIRRADYGRADTRKIEEVRMLTLRSLSWLQDAETGQRGYLLTGSPELEAQFREGADSTMKRLAELNALTKDEEEQQRYLRTLIPLVERRLNKLDELLRMRRTMRPDQIINMPVGPGIAMMDSARQIFVQMWAVETRVQERREARERSDQLLLQWALGIGFLIAAIVSYMIGARLAENAMNHWMMTAELNARVAMLRDKENRGSGETRTTPTGNDAIT